MWPSQHNHRQYYYHNNQLVRNDNPKKKNMSSGSSPINIQGNATSSRSWSSYSDSSDESDQFEDEDQEMVPPHVLVARRNARKSTAFSVCTGNGRTLKGRDLSKVRNSVLRMTGFLET
ncbi:hypothetical protein IFM89_013631 [Coptis chinensis]|uniref:Senescence regulator n=1 Tax=Coptis chinensis TaxID=261450 RepID=A0A835M630_9MAGN|nr:hypothetical protein IFM89_013631 [Coptis chinensis]